MTFVQFKRHALTLGALRPNAGVSPELQNRQPADETQIEMLFILIPIAWLGILTLFVALCHTAAQGDAQLSAGAPAPSGSIGVKLRLSSAPQAPSRELRRPHHRPAPRRAPATATRRRSLAAHSGR